MTEKLETILRRTGHDPFKFNDMLERWNAAFENDRTNPVTPELEQAADQAILEITARDDSELIGGRLRLLVQSLTHAAFVVDEHGKLTGINEAAMRSTLLGPGDPLDDLEFKIEKAEQISSLVRRSISQRNSTGEVVLKRAMHKTDDRSASIAIVPSLQTNEAPSALVSD
ncbi:MAG: hypothetical protein ABJH45_00275 [Paracoccaceae bacterium]